MSGLVVSATSRSHIGSVRTVNEDRVLNDETHRLWAIADGMGGHSRGDMAAQIVVSALAKLGASGLPVAPLSIDHAMRAANDEICSLNDRAGSQSGATVAGLFFDGVAATIFWAGDSRVYRQRGGTLALLTRDDRALQDMIEAGLLSREQARRHPRATIITRAIGASGAVELSYRAETLEAGDTYLLCSDGLTDLVEDEAINAALSGAIDAAAALLIRSALVGGGHDNVSIVIVHVEAMSAAKQEAHACATRL